MKIIKSYNESISLSLFKINDKKTIFSFYKNRENFQYWLKYRKNKNVILSKKQKKLLKIIDNNETLWFDGFGFGLMHLSNNIKSIEHLYFKKILLSVKSDNSIFFVKNMFSAETLFILKKKFFNNIIVLDSKNFEYMQLNKLIKFLNYFRKKFNKQKIICVINLKKIDFNKLRYSNKDFIHNVCNHLKTKVILYKISEFDYILEFIN